MSVDHLQKENGEKGQIRRKQGAYNTGEGVRIIDYPSIRHYVHSQ